MYAHLVLGCCDDQGALLTCRLSTSRQATELERLPVVMSSRSHKKVPSSPSRTNP